MNPTHLRPRELDYELNVRRVVGLSTSRTKIVALRDLLKKEALGIEQNPTDSSFAYPVEEELVECDRVWKTIDATMDGSEAAHGSLMLDEAENRIIHLKARLRRIKARSSADDNTLRYLFERCDELVRRVALMGRASIKDRVSFNIAPDAGAISSNIANNNEETQPAPPSSEQSNIRSVQSDFCGFGENGSGRIQMSDIPVRGRGRGSVRSSMPSAGIHAVQGRGRAVTPSQFTERLRIPVSQSLLDLDQVGGSEVTARIEWEDELRQLADKERRNTGVTAGHIDNEPLLCQHNQMNRNANSYTAANSAGGQQSRIIYTETQQSHNIENETQQNQNANFHSAARSAVGQQSHNVNIETYINRNANSFTAANWTVGRPSHNINIEAYQNRNTNSYTAANSPVGQQSRNVYTETRQSVPNQEFRDASFHDGPTDHNLNFANNVHVTDEVLEKGIPKADNRPEPRGTYTIYGNGSLPRSASRQQEANASNSGNRYANEYGQDSFTIPVNSANARTNTWREHVEPSSQGGHSNRENRFVGNRHNLHDDRQNYGENNPGHDREVPPHQNIGQPYNYRDYREPNNGYDAPRSQVRNRYRKTVPINQWRINFSGDGRGLHLYDFLSQVAMLQRAEQVTEEELMYSVVHLLSGRAKQWYGSVYGTFDSWNDLVDLLKYEFLPKNYDFSLLDEISNRKQKSSESFGEYLTHMQSMFNWLDIPIDDKHKLYIVQRNLLPRYATCVAPIEIRSIRHLAEVCRRVDSANPPSRNSVGLPFEQPTQSTRHGNYKPNHVHEIENELVSAEECENELCALRNPAGKRNAPATENRQINRDGTCYNCHKNGHAFRSCPEPRKGVFCYVCGGKDVTTKTCDRCAGNERRDLAKEKDPQGSTAAALS